MNAVMLDIETLDTAESAVVLSIGACAFNLHGGEILDDMHVHLDLRSQVENERTMSPSTVMWWLQQNDEARRGILTTDRVNVQSAIADLRSFVKDWGLEGGVWGNGAMFDNAIVCSLANAFYLERPWSHKLDRCYRTVKNLSKKPILLEFEGVAHNALHDAEYQAKVLQLVWKELGL